jgi:hypothetical protein
MANVKNLFYEMNLDSTRLTIIYPIIFPINFIKTGSAQGIFFHSHEDSGKFKTALSLEEYH